MTTIATTIGIVEQFGQTLDVKQFRADISRLDGVSRRQCILRARREIPSVRLIALHGAEDIKSALDALEVLL